MNTVTRQSPFQTSFNPIRRILAVFLVAALGALTGCAALVSDQQELALGQKYRQELAQKVQLDQNPANLQYINAMGQRLSAAAPPRPGVPLSFHIVVDDSLNAFAIPGGHVYVNTGTIKGSSDEAELAAVMAHEIGHVVGEHHKQTMARAMGADLLNQMVFGGAGGQSEAAAQAVGQIVAQGVLLRYSREQEYDADVIGLQTLAGAGYDPYGMIRFFEKIHGESGRGSPRFAEFLSSHPLTTQRIDRARQIIATLQLPPNPRRDSPEFQAFRARFR